ncbi:MAG TPA: DUF2961 domain-containing protein [Planctomycetota bacterium]|jgi:hypothetical protein|nr:DUF2961 domain-containing protein [Planctomycetota bacterium]OQC19759.1 MAG: hypothetical protein BWX69_02426 [Planctomycetes bacterium ADurb.Bin069]HNR97731.1 DUF2961 domain-containing protein [Planctomycetota bacterium]HNU24802.1 DUF2961 domain-containing protein [Planctomycetota bacterium]HOE30900.1 DUF2961 domain-containing protein [Planctomycetota bacterium]
MTGEALRLLPLARCCLVAAAAILPSTVGRAAAPAEEPRSYADILRELTDLDRLTFLQKGCKGGLFSSWDRNGRKVWGANGDAGHYLRVEPNGEAVMADIDGPGVIYRIWSANPMGKLRLYLDGAQTPTYEWNFPDLFGGKLPPFEAPFVYRRDAEQSASDCYLPIPFAAHIKITADKAHGQYYQFNYVLFPKERPVASFRLPLSPEEARVLAAAADVWSHPGRDPKPRLAGQETIAMEIAPAPGGSVEICALRGTGVIRAVRARVSSDQRYAWRKLVLRGEWDGAGRPQVLTPLGPFFGFDWDTAEYGSVVAGCRDGLAYQFFPMPFRKSAVLTLENHLEAPASVRIEIEWAPLTRLPDDAVYFYARWRSEPDCLTFDYPFLETAGRGHFVGVSMPIDHPLPGWWGEGDEKVWVDNDDWPPFIGTGSEDYFGDAWGIRYLSGPSFGAASATGHRTCNYRWHFMDFIPFARRMRMTIENYGPNGLGPRGQYEYTSTAFWYQSEPTPPFEELRGVKYTGAADPGDAPGPMEYNPDVFGAVDADRLRTYGLGIVFARQGEDLLAEAVKSGAATIVTDALRPYEFDRERAVSFGAVASGARLGEFTLDIAAAGVYYPRIHTAQEQGIADLTLESGGEKLKIAARPAAHVLQLEAIFLAKGNHAVRLLAAGDGQAIFDCLQLEPAARFSEAIEAEELAVVRTTGGAEPPRASAPEAGVSAGRVLAFRAGGVDRGFVLSLGKRPALPYVLGARPMQGPAAGVIQAFVAGAPIGPRFDLYHADRRLGPEIVPLGSVPADATAVEIRVVGRNERSRGWDAEIDYLRWEPSILGPGTTEGVWAQVARTRGCDYRPQNLGPAYSDGHQFWVQPSNHNARVDLALQIPRAGSYEITVRYTKSWDYAAIQAFLDGAPIGPVVDTYAPSVVPSDPLLLGTRDLSAGRHVLGFQATARNPESKGYLMGIDHVIVKALDGDRPK